MQLQDLKNSKEAKTSALITECGMFFAFSDKQFEENKTPLQDGDNYVRLFSGSYLPKSNVDKFISGAKEIDAWFEQSISDNNLRKDQIVYELSNHEAYYTGEIDDTLDALGETYTREEVWAIYREQLQYQD